MKFRINQLPDGLEFGKTYKSSYWSIKAIKILENQTYRGLDDLGCKMNRGNVYVKVLKTQKDTGMMTIKVGINIWFSPIWIIKN